jgi:hypothetical protein
MGIRLPLQARIGAVKTSARVTILAQDFIEGTKVGLRGKIQLMAAVYAQIRPEGDPEALPLGGETRFVS